MTGGSYPGPPFVAGSTVVDSTGAVPFVTLFVNRFPHPSYV
jgi:hypothetical protein